MIYLLDTNACVLFLRQGGASRVGARILATPPDEIALCAVVEAELLLGALRSRDVPRSLAETRTFLSTFQSLPFDSGSAEHHAEIRADLMARGLPIGERDSMIAAIALANGLILVTHNTREFGRVAGLVLEDWEI